MTKDDKIGELCKTLAIKNNIDPTEIDLIIDSMWEFIREKASSLKLYVPTEELDGLKTNFNIPSLGKLYVSKEAHAYRINKIKSNKNEETKV